MIKKRFGTIAIDMGFITQGQLVEALTIQVRDNILNKPHRKIGDILVDQGWMTKDQQREVLKTMSQAVLFTLASGR
ncbi:MAG: hypothetical protein WBM78_09690 [Desulfobacterales bacterium]